MEGRAERAQAQGSRHPKKAGERVSELRAGPGRREHKEPAAVTFLLARRARGSLTCTELWPWPAGKLRPDPGQATKLAWHCVRTAAALSSGLLLGC